MRTVSDLTEPVGCIDENMRAVMIRLLRRKNDRAQIVEEAFLKYINACRNFCGVSEQRAMSVQHGGTKIPHDRMLVWQDMFGIQRLFIERQALRFEYLLRDGVFNLDTWISLNSITERLDKEWSEKEEMELKESSTTYNEVSREIKERQSRLNASALRGPGKTLQQDAKYRNARLALAKEIERLDKNLSR
jgi:hypothetical protein